MAATDPEKQISYSSISARNRGPKSAITFAGLELRLLSYLRDMIRKGEITERSLARITGISQPHLHNVLKGKRLLSTEKADQILSYLRLDLRSFLDSGDQP